MTYGAVSAARRTLRILKSSTALIVVLAWPITSVQAATLGGTGGDGGYGGAGGSPNLTTGASAPGVNGTQLINIGTGGGGGSAGITGGAGGAGGSSAFVTSVGAGGTGGVAAIGGVGGDGGNGGGGTSGSGGGGGGGGAIGAVSATFPLASPVQGGKGGNGGNSNSIAGGGGGGGGGFGAFITGTGGTNSSSITGGTGGNGGTSDTAYGGDLPGGNGGAGGAGVVFAGTGSLINSGTIQGGNGGKAGIGGTAVGVSHNGAGGVGVAGSGLTIINSGSISGGLSGDGVTRANAITFTGGANTLTLLSGSSISGNIAIDGGGSLNFAQSTDATLGNAITGSGSLTKTGTGTLILNGVNTYTGGTTVSGGILEVGDINHSGASLAGDVTVDASGTLRGHGTVLGSVTNTLGGIVAPGGSIGTLSVGGNYVQGANSTLSIEVSPTAASQLAVTGSASLAGTLQLVFDPGVYSVKSYTIVTAGGGVTGTFSTVTGGTGFNPSLSYLANAVSLGIFPVTVISTNDTVFGALGTTALQGSQQANGTVLGHLMSPLCGSGQEQVPGQVCALNGAWAKVTGSYGRLDGSGTIPGFDTRGGGFVTGIDRQVSNNLTLGFAGGNSYTSLDQKDGESGTIRTPRVLAYGRYSWGPWALGASLGYAYDSIKSKRPITALNEVASASYGANELTGALALGRKVSVNGFSLMPTVGLTYAHISQGAFTETGSPGFDLSVAARSANSLKPYVGLSATKTFTTASGMQLTPEVDIHLSHEMKSTPATLVQVGGGNFSVAGLAPTRNELRLGLGVAAKVSPRLNLYARYQATLPTGNQFQESLKAGLTYRF